jgi:signal transduction histidine kinase
VSDQAERSATAQANGRIDRLTGWFDRLLPFRQLRPLQRIPSLKVKLSILILAAVGVTIAAGTVGFWLNVRPRFSVVAAVLLALAMVQILARGITTPVREMADAADRMAGGHYDQQVSADGADEIGQLARSFNLMAAHIAELEQQHRDLIANVSHELRTPLAVLQGSLENLIDGVEADRPATLEAMVRQTARLSRLVTQLLDLSRLDAGVAPFHPEPMDLVAVIDDVVDEVRLRQPPPDLVIDMPSELTMTGDAERLHQVVANLVDNALRYAPTAAPVRITVEPAADRVIVAVADDGPGIAADQVEWVFGRFNRASHASASPGGFGLGLAIGRWIAELHGGSLRVVNTDPGCRFELELPLSSPSGAAPAAVARAPASEPQTTSTGPAS